MAVMKYSRQREAIKEYLSQTIEHPTADTVYMNIRKQYPNISLGTVYRNLNLLAEQGEILKINCRDGSDRFDGNPNPHYHFICNGCGRVFDLEMESIDHINVIAGEHFKGNIEGHITFFYGSCPDCNQ
ncbi:transcriptional repressor [Mobilitalea sibirica]|uniref:Transcriptional repressor n=1 Tax=Mobilitalea sibirica TaxID=1462919 RepID=A0A8J7HC64_9FIRM|nr:transcriptional repressor [Mobilitalea sibirica]MBH1942080.1 transcriptional repressor [Mobilitalea sibirica]